MPRRKNSIFQDIAHATAKFPWWAGVFFALVSFLFLHAYAGKALPPSAVSGADGIFKGAAPGLLHLAALFGQFVLPAAFLLGSITSVVLNFKRTRLYDGISRSESLNSLNTISWQDFEYLVGEYFRRRQFSVEETRAGADGGVDLVATKGMEKYLVQCKHWKAYKVGVHVVRELLGVMAGVGARDGFVVTSGEFTKDARDFARANNILLLDGRELLNSMRSYATLEDLPEKKKGGRLHITACAFAGLLLVAVGCFFLAPKAGISLHAIIPPQVTALLPDYLGHLSSKISQSIMPDKQAAAKDGRFTEEQVARAMEEVLREQQDKNGEGQKYYYEVELFSGGRFFTDNVIVTNKAVTYKSDKGLIVSLNREEVKTMKKIRLD